MAALPTFIIELLSYNTYEGVVFEPSIVYNVVSLARKNWLSGTKEAPEIYANSLH